MTGNIENLVISAKNGDIDAFGTLAEQFYPALTAIAYANTKRHHLAEDSAQETLKRALVNLKKLNNPGKFAPWLCAICRNVSRDILKKQITQLTVNDTIQAHETHDNCENERKNELVRMAIANLPDTDREIIILRYYNDLSYQQISDILGISIAAINGRVKRAKQKIATLLKQDNYPETNDG